ncbi:NOL1/NOP2/sun family putative RNA methylase [Paenibacillus sp. OAE614]
MGSGQRFYIKDRMMKHMALKLPAAFQERMRSLLKEEYTDFMDSYDLVPRSGIRVNTLKISTEDLLSIAPWDLRPIPWCGTGFYTEAGERPGRHPYYHAGLYYIQEPSAMAPVELLDVTPGEAVLDLCAAPGGKSTQIAAKLRGTGMLVSNDLNADRTKALAKNIELYGVRNAVVLNEHPDRIAEKFPAFFDKILIDAPCSGEGMFRKDEAMIKEWDGDSPLKYADMQRGILRAAATMLRPGGRIVYSTCTFSPEENEGMIAEFVAGHPEFRVLPVGGTGSFAAGETDWLKEQGSGFGHIPDQVWEQVRGTARLWPHRIEGEGHFLAVLQHEADPESAAEAERARDALLSSTAPAESADRPKGKERPTRNAKPMKGKPAKKGAGNQGEAAPTAAYEAFIREHLLGFVPGGHTVVYGSHIYQSPLPPSLLDGLKVVRPGWYMGDAKNGRFVPAHPLATALHPGEFIRVIRLDSGSGEAVRYLKGETLRIPEDRVECGGEASPKGYALVCIDGYSAGWGKWQEGMLKNEYPAGWRWTSA